MDFEGTAFKVLPTKACQISESENVGILPA